MKLNSKIKSNYDKATFNKVPLSKLYEEENPYEKAENHMKEAAKAALKEIVPEIVKNNLHFTIPDGYELITDKSYKLKRGDYLFNRTGERSVISNWADNTINDIETVYGSNYFYFIKKIEKPKTKEELRLIAREKAKVFVDTFIPNPAPQTYKRFEEAFLKDCKIGY